VRRISAVAKTSVIITINGVLILRGSLHDLLDRNIDALLVENVKNVASSVKSVMDVEKCRIRKSGYFVDLHVQVTSDMTARDGHTIGHQVKRTP
jgi:divalent metal cation (Fe/Co/Zn/Cd) transporter